MSNPRPHLLRTLAFTLGLGISACSPTETEVALQAESWGAFEHTHADFVSNYRPPHSDKPLSLRTGRDRLEVTDKDKRMIASTEINVP
jgi:hypothetical protein